LFWEDLWTPIVLSNEFPNLYSAAWNKRASVKEVLAAEDLASLFHLPLSEQAFQELGDLQQTLATLEYQPTEIDSWTFLWGNDRYSSRKFYAMVFNNVTTPPTFAMIWKSKCTPRLKFFAWLMIADRLNTRNMLRRRHFHLDAGYNCVLCSASPEEDVWHLFFDCQFSRECWATLNVIWPDTQDIHELLAGGRSPFGRQFFMELFIVASWEIWNMRNEMVFNGVQACRRSWIVKFKRQILLQLLRVKEEYHPPIVTWLDTIV